jgi:hypothetical protein
MKRNPLKSALIALIGLTLGLLLAGQVNSFLGIAYLPKDLPQEPRLSARPVSPATPPLEPVAAIVLPPGTLQSDLYARAAAALADALAERTGTRPPGSGVPRASPQGLAHPRWAWGGKGAT